jgi:hypothetical protein
MTGRIVVASGICDELCDLVLRDVAERHGLRWRTGRTRFYPQMGYHGMYAHEVEAEEFWEKLPDRRYAMRVNSDGTDEERVWRPGCEPAPRDE